jgi:hypothetical protein
MDDKKNPKKSMGWGWIIFWIIIFWPVGFILVIRKFATDKKALMSGKTTSLSVIGWVLTVFGGIGFIGCVTDPTATSGTVMALIFVVGGILLILKARKIKKQAAKYRKYIDVVVNYGEKNIDNIADAVGLQYEVVIKDLQDMIDIGYLKNAYIHQANREILLQQVVQPQVQQAYQQTQTYQQLSNPIQPKAVRCPGCGANNIVSTSGVCECEYCGTPLTI